MALKLIIPEDVVEALKIPAKDQEQELDKELALSLYQRGALPLGKARKLAGISKWEFQRELAQRKIERHYTETELQEDIAYARSHK